MQVTILSRADVADMFRPSQAVLRYELASLRERAKDLCERIGSNNRTMAAKGEGSFAEQCRRIAAVSRSSHFSMLNRTRAAIRKLERQIAG